MTSRRLEYLRRTSVDAYDRALRALDITVTLDAMLREMARGDQRGMLLNRDAAIADTVEWILRREDRIVLAAHNGHVQRRPVTMPGMLPATPMGMHLADRLGKDYLVIGATSGTGQILNTEPDFYAGTLFTDMEETPQPGSLDALMAASHDGPFAVDMRRLSPTDATTLRAVSRQRFGMGTFYAEQSPPDAYDLVVHLPQVTPADPDDDALAAAPHDVQEPFSRWKRQ